MSNFGGPNSRFEKDFAKRFRILDNSLSRIEDRILAILQQSVANPRKSKAYWDAVRKQLDTEYKKMVAVFGGWSSKEIPQRFRSSIRGLNRRFNSIKAITNTATKTSTQLIASRGAYDISQLLVQNAVQDFATAVAAGKRNVYRWTRLTQQKLISDAQIDLTIGSIFSETGNLGRAITGVKTDLWNELTKAMEGQRYVQAGSRRYRPRYYAEMVSRVKFHEAQTEASLMQAANYDTDLVLVSSHNTTTAICQEYEGKVYSISGKDKRFPVMTQSPPYHVNCLHLIYPTFESSMEVQGTLDSFSAFSKGKISKPPMPASFVPIGDRG